jgi:hypothetical protein
MSCFFEILNGIVPFSSNAEDELLDDRLERIDVENAILRCKRAYRSRSGESIKFKLCLNVQT